VCTWTQNRLGNSSSWMVSIAVIFTNPLPSPNAAVHEHSAFADAVSAGGVIACQLGRTMGSTGIGPTVQQVDSPVTASLDARPATEPAI
jgi:hypothetical protein